MGKNAFLFLLILLIGLKVQWAFSSQIEEETELWQLLEELAGVHGNHIKSAHFQQILKQVITAQIAAIPPWEVIMEAETDPELPPEDKPDYSKKIVHLWVEVLRRELNRNLGPRFRTLFSNPSVREFKTFEDVLQFAQKLSPYHETQFLILLYGLEQTSAVANFVFNESGAYWIYSLNLVARYGHLNWQRDAGFRSSRFETFFNNDFLRMIVTDADVPLIELARQTENPRGFVEKVIYNIFSILERRWLSDRDPQNLQAAVGIVTALYTSARWLKALGVKTTEYAVLPMLMKIRDELPEVRPWWIQELERGNKQAQSPYERYQFRKLLNLVQTTPLPATQAEANPWIVIRCEPLFKER